VRISGAGQAWPARAEPVTGGLSFAGLISDLAAGAAPVWFQPGLWDGAGVGYGPRDRRRFGLWPGPGAGGACVDLRSRYVVMHVRVVFCQPVLDHGRLDGEIETALMVRPSLALRRQRRY